MKNLKTFLSASLLLPILAIGCSKSESAESQSVPPTPSATDTAEAADNTPAGYWEGEITLPGTALGVRVDLSNEAGWSGTIDIPIQGLRGFELGDVAVEGENVSFKMPNIPGDPMFDGKLSSDAQTIAGKFSQTGQTFEFTIARAERKLEKGETPSAGIPGSGFAGAWQGSLKVNLMEMRLLFKLNGGDSEMSGTMDSIDQGAKDMVLDVVKVKGKSIHMEMKSIGGSFDGDLNADGSEIKGEWKQSGRIFPLTILRLEKAPDMSRPQDPKKPYPYNEQEVVFRNEGARIQLAGTLTYPKGAGPHPAVVLITGSGAQDRDEAIMGHRPFLVLADHLTRNGIAVLRYDDRGFGKSKGKFSTALTTDFTTDALAAVDFLKTIKEVDNKRIGLVGHSEGGLVAPQAAAQSEDVAFIVLLAGVGVPMDQLLARQAADIVKVMGGHGEMMEKQAATQKEIFSLLKEKGDSPDIRQQVRAIIDKSIEEFDQEQRDAMGVTEAQIEGQVRMVTSPWFLALLTTDPTPTLEKVKCPVLAINGKKDVQVAWEENLNAIDAGLKKGGNKNVEIKAFDDLNHLFQKCETGAMSEYGLIEETFNPVALETVSDWIRETTGL